MSDDDAYNKRCAEVLNKYLTTTPPVWPADIPLIEEHMGNAIKDLVYADMAEVERFVTAKFVPMLDLADQHVDMYLQQVRESMAAGNPLTTTALWYAIAETAEEMPEKALDILCLALATAIQRLAHLA